MMKYKSYGKGWHFDSQRHSLAAKGIRTSLAIRKTWERFKKESSVPVFGKRAVAEELQARKMTDKRAKELIIAGSLSDLPKSREEKMALRELELTLQPRERRGIRILQLITNKISVPEPFEDFDHYEARTKSRIAEFVPLSSKVEIRLPVRGTSSTGVVTAGEPPSVEQYIDYLFEHRYKERFGYYDPSTKSFTASYKGRASSLESYGGKIKEAEAERISEAIEPLEEQKRREEEANKPLVFETMEIKPSDVEGMDVEYGKLKTDIMRRRR
jgi:hypothetical protein